MTVDDKDHTGLATHKITLPFHLNRKKTLMTTMSSLSIHLFRVKADFLGARLVGLFPLVFISVGRVEISSLSNLIPYCTITLLEILLTEFSRPSLF